ncbi:peptidoglycan-binding domain-containing protein, partial [Alkalibacillus haloalkaliphilus]|uniref:peptidoglycan-binding domain-containing protein n=1 Tax=Alkalibacillus haloalkaliphilus TaxID=94136 RepID=UPI001479643C
MKKKVFLLIAFYLMIVNIPIHADDSEQNHEVENEIQEDVDEVESEPKDQESQEELESSVETKSTHGVCSEENEEFWFGLEKLNFLSSLNSGECDSERVIEALSSFQEYYELDVTEEFDEETVDTLNNVLASPLQSGNYHEDSVTIKGYLMLLGYGEFSQTTYFGPQTESAVKAFQRDYNLVENGIVDDPTLSKLEYEATKPLEEG